VMRIRPKIAMLTGAAIVTLGASGIATALATGGSHHARAAAGPTVPVAHSVDRRLVTRMGVFRGAHAAGAASVRARSPQSALAPAGPLPPDSGANIRLAARVETPLGAIYIVPGIGTVCQIGAGIGGCGKIANLGTIGFSVVGKTGLDAPNVERVVGIVPDDVVALYAGLVGGQTVRIPISENAFAATVHGFVSTLIYHTTRGVRTESFPTPPSRAELLGIIAQQRAMRARAFSARPSRAQLLGIVAQQRARRAHALRSKR
jgi:hypothetical protein